MQVNSSYTSSASSALQGLLGTQSADEMDNALSTEIMKAKDADSSGSLSASELGVSSTQLAEFDTDGDGEVSSAELAAGLKAQRKKMQAQMQTQMQQSGQMGMLQASMGAGQAPPDMEQKDSEMAQGILEEKDTDGDGVLSAEELGVSAENLSAVDTDGDGVVSESELTASLKSQREQMMAENGGQMPPPPEEAGGASGTSGTSASGMPSTDEIIARLFGDSSDSGTTASADTSTTLTAEFLKKQKASNAYLNMDRLISDLFSGSDDVSQAVSVSA